MCLRLGKYHDILVSDVSHGSQEAHIYLDQNRLKKIPQDFECHTPFCSPLQQEKNWLIPNQNSKIFTSKLYAWNIDRANTFKKLIFKKNVWQAKCLMHVIKIQADYLFILL